MPFQVVYNKTFECCVEKALRSSEDLIHVHHFYNSTQNCRQHLSTDIDGEDYLSLVLKFYMEEFQKNTTADDCYTATPSCGGKTKDWYNAYIVFWIIALIIGLVGNVLVCVTFCQSAVLRRSVTNYFVTSLALSDLLAVIFIIPVKIHFALNNHDFCAPLEVCKMYFTTDVTFFVASITNLFAITIDRYLAITRPYDYKEILTPARSKIIIVLIWISSAIWGIMINYNSETGNFDNIIINENKCFPKHRKMYYITQYSVVFFLPSLIMLVVYAKILRIALSHAKTMDSRRVTHGSDRNNNRSQQAKFFTNRKLELRATKVVLVVYGTFIVCWLPVILVTLGHLLKVTESTSLVIYTIFGEMLPVINSILNPFIYGILHRDFKHGIKRMLGILYLEHQLKSKNHRKSYLDMSSLSRRTCSINSPRSHIEILSPVTEYPDVVLNTTQESIVLDVNDGALHLDVPNNCLLKKTSLTDSEFTASSHNSDENNPLIKSIISNNN